MSSFAVTNPEDAFLPETDGTAVSFWIFSIAMGNLRRGTNECLLEDVLWECSNVVVRGHESG